MHIPGPKTHRPTCFLGIFKNLCHIFYSPVTIFSVILEIITMPDQ